MKFPDSHLSLSESHVSKALFCFSCDQNISLWWNNLILVERPLRSSPLQFTQPGIDVEHNRTLSLKTVRVIKVILAQER